MLVIMFPIGKKKDKNIKVHFKLTCGTCLKHKCIQTEVWSLMKYNANFSRQCTPHNKHSTLQCSLHTSQDAHVPHWFRLGASLVEFLVNWEMVEWSDITMAC